MPAKWWEHLGRHREHNPVAAPRFRGKWLQAECRYQRAVTLQQTCKRHPN
jgi:hypothetical protein